MTLSFDWRKIPRSLTRAEWREIDRWRRKAQRQIRAEITRQQNDVAVFGTAVIGFAPRQKEKESPDETS